MVDDTPNHTTTVIERRGSGAGIIVAIALLIAVVAGIYFFNQYQHSEMSKNNAVEDAAKSVGNAADQVGNAAQDATK